MVVENPLPTGNTLNAVTCPGTRTCYAVGDVGTLLMTTNGGSTWRTPSSNTSQVLFGISCRWGDSCRWGVGVRTCGQPATQLLVDTGIGIRARRVRHILPDGSQSQLQHADLFPEFETTWAARPVVAHVNLC
jgi:hypothetical protein